MKTNFKRVCLQKSDYKAIAKDFLKKNLAYFIGDEFYNNKSFYYKEKVNENKEYIIYVNLKEEDKPLNKIIIPKMVTFTKVMNCEKTNKTKIFVDIKEYDLIIDTRNSMDYIINNLNNLDLRLIAYIKNTNIILYNMIYFIYNEKAHRLLFPHYGNSKYTKDLFYRAYNQFISYYKNNNKLIHDMMYIYKTFMEIFKYEIESTNNHRIVLNKVIDTVEDNTIYFNIVNPLYIIELYKEERYNNLKYYIKINIDFINKMNIYKNNLKKENLKYLNILNKSNILEIMENIVKDLDSKKEKINYE